MNCFCNLFDTDNMWWIIILILLILYCNAGSGCGCGCGGCIPSRPSGGCGCN